MSDINPSLVSSELTTIETFKDTTEKRGSKLTLNELNYISDKQLHSKGGSGGSSSPVKVANIVFHTPTGEDLIETYVKSIGPALACVYTPAQEGAPAVVSALPDDVLNVTAEVWNSQNLSIIVPAAFGLANEYPRSFELEITGDAEIMSITGGNVVYITGDCTITIEANQK